MVHDSRVIHICAVSKYPSCQWHRVQGDAKQSSLVFRQAWLPGFKESQPALDYPVRFCLILCMQLLQCHADVQGFQFRSSAGQTPHLDTWTTV